MDELTKSIKEAFAKAFAETTGEGKVQKETEDDKNKDVSPPFNFDNVAKAVGEVITQFLGDDFKEGLVKDIFGKLKEAGVEMDEPDVKISDLTVKELGGKIGSIIEEKVTEAVKKSGIKVSGVRKSQGKDAIDDVPADDDKDENNKEEPVVEKSFAGFNKAIGNMSPEEYDSLPADEKQSIRKVVWGQLLFGKRNEMAGISVDGEQQL